MTLVAMAFLQAKYKFDPGLLYIGAFIFDLTALQVLLEILT